MIKRTIAALALPATVAGLVIGFIPAPADAATAPACALAKTFDINFYGGIGGGLKVQTLANGTDRVTVTVGVGQGGGETLALEPLDPVNRGALVAGAEYSLTVPRGGTNSAGFEWIGTIEGSPGDYHFQPDWKATANANGVVGDESGCVSLQLKLDNPTPGAKVDWYVGTSVTFNFDPNNWLDSIAAIGPVDVSPQYWAGSNNNAAGVDLGHFFWWVGSDEFVATPVPPGQQPDWVLYEVNGQQVNPLPAAGPHYPTPNPWNGTAGYGVGVPAPDGVGQIGGYGALGGVGFPSGDGITGACTTVLCAANTL